MEVPRSRIDAVRAGEESMARRIALAYLLAQPLSLATTAIPGKFIYDALKRSREKRWSRDRYLPPRLEALEVAARQLAEGVEADAASSAGDPRARLVGRLADHYARLLSVDGRRHEDLLRAAFPSPTELEAEWEAIADLESELDDLACQARHGDEKLAARLEGYREHTKEQRRRLLQELYYE